MPSRIATALASVLLLSTPAPAQVTCFTHLGIAVLPGNDNPGCRPAGKGRPR